MKYMKLGSKPDVFQSDGNNIKFVATELATDIVINAGDVKFYLHKFPLLSKSSRLQKLVAAKFEEDNEEIDINEIPGGPVAFEICAKFCYGMIVTLNAYNVVVARCAAEFLEMNEAIEKGNLIYKIDVFLNCSIFQTWKDSIIVLQTTRSLLPLSEDLKIVSKCIDSIASNASIDPSEVEWSYTYNRKKLPSENGIDSHWNGVKKQQTVPKDWWVEDLCELEMDLYKQILMSIKTKGKISSEIIGEAIKAYSLRRLPVFVKGNITNVTDCVKYQSILETVVWLLPTERHAVSCNFLLKLLRAACVLECGETCKMDLMKRIGRQLEEASVLELLFPVTTVENGLYNIDLVISIVKEFVMQNGSITQSNPEDPKELIEVKIPVVVTGSSNVAVGKLIDGYLAEVAKDPNLPLSKFVQLAEMVNGDSRPSHDGLYRAIDMYLKEHPGLSKSEKKKICGVMDCKKLSAEACLHAAQNERLPLRIVVQVLFFQQMKAYAAAGMGVEIPGSVKSMLFHENGSSYSSSRSATTTNTEDDWDGLLTAGNANSFKFPSIAGKGGVNRRSSGSSDVNKNGADKSPTKAKEMLMSKKMLSKLWSGKLHTGENSSSDISESPGSITHDGSKSTPSRNTRHYSVS